LNDILSKFVQFDVGAYMKNEDTRTWMRLVSQAQNIQRYRRKSDKSSSKSDAKNPVLRNVDSWQAMRRWPPPSKL
jgi:hypothetical protein